MKARTVAISLACAIVAGGSVYSLCYCWVYGHMVGGEAAVSSGLWNLRTELYRYHDARKNWPEKLSDLGEFSWKDHIAEKPYLYFPGARRGTTDILAAQPEPYRLGLWPFGQIKRQVILATSVGAKTTLCGQEATSLRISEATAREFRYEVSPSSTNRSTPSSPGATR